MSLTLGGSNSGAMRSLSYMSATKAKMDKSLQRISSGHRILSASDDPGGLAVAMKLKSQISNYDAQKDNVENAKSYVEAQSTALQTTAEIVSEMQSLKGQHTAAAGDATTQQTYENQFQDLRTQLRELKGESLNGTKLFDRGDTSMTVSSTTLTDLAYGAALVDGTQDIAGTSSGDGVTLSSVSEDNLVEVHDNVTNLIAEAAGDESSLGFASEYLSSMSANLETAHGRIMDVDLAEESANYASLTLQYEAAAAAVAQANTSAARVFDLLIGSINRD